MVSSIVALSYIQVFNLLVDMTLLDFAGSLTRPDIIVNGNEVNAFSYTV